MRGVLHLTEAVLAIVLVVLAINGAQENLATEHVDYMGGARLRAAANDLVFSQCNDQNLRYNMTIHNDLRNVSVPQIAWSMPKDVDWSLHLYSQGGVLLDSKGGTPPQRRETVTASCIIAGQLELTDITNHTYFPRKMVSMVWAKEASP